MGTRTAIEARHELLGPTGLSDAIAAGEIHVYAQPIVRLLTGKVCEVEALVRWESKRFGTIRPDVFIPELEAQGLIHVLDAEVLRLSCAQWAEARKEGTNVPFGINLSRRDFELCDIFEVVMKTMGEFDVPVDQVHIEITETAFTDSPELVAQGVRRFREAGFKLLLDDFGTGYSSLDALKNLDFDIVKIDMSLVSDIETNERARVILADVISMIKRLGLQTLCEGIETKEQLEFLKAVGCEKGQGYYFGKPASHAQTMNRLAIEALRYEDPLYDDYFDSIGQVSMLDGTSAHTHGVQAAAFLGRQPIAIVELHKEEISLLSSNAAFSHLLETLNLDSFESLMSADSSLGVHAHTLRAARQSRETGEDAEFDTFVGTALLSMALSHIACANERDAFLVRALAVIDAPRVTESVLLSGILESSEAKIFWKDEQRRFLGANQAFLDYFGLTSVEEILGRTDEEMGWHNDPEPFKSDEDDVLFGEPAIRVKGTCFVRGELRRIIASKRALVSNGRVVGLVGTFEDDGSA